MLLSSFCIRLLSLVICHSCLVFWFHLSLSNCFRLQGKAGNCVADTCFPSCLFWQLERQESFKVSCCRNSSHCLSCCRTTGLPTGSLHDSCSLLLFTGYEETLMRLAAILAKHFADSRIVGTGNAALLFFGVICCSPGWPHCQWLSSLLLGSTC